MLTLTLPKRLSDEEAAGLAGKLLTDQDYDTLIETDTTIRKAHDGAPLLVFRKNALYENDCRAAYTNLYDAATATDNRGQAAGEFFNDESPRNIGKRTRLRLQEKKRDGTLSNTNRAKIVDSGIVGYFDRNPRFPYCRLTAYNINHPTRFQAALPFIRSVDQVFAESVPERYAVQKAIVERTSKDFYISGTVFTTITVNLNFVTAVHKDVGDYAPGFGVLAALRAGVFDGFYFCLPQYKVAVDMRSGDVLMVDVHEWHGNTPVKAKKPYQRLSMVFYYREKMQYCLDADSELERAKTRERGTPING